MITKDNRMIPEGVVAAALTPRGKRGELNFGAAFELIDHLCRANVRGIALLTAAGEYPAFSIEERKRLVYLGAKRSRVPLLAGVGSEELETSLDLARDALAAGAEGVLLPPPLLFGYPPEDLCEYYLQFSGQLPRDASIWIVPTSHMAMDTAESLAASGRFAGIVGQRLDVSTEACAVPELYVALDCARRTGNPDRVAALAACAREFEEWAGCFAPLVAVKSATELRGIQMGALPVPVAPHRQPTLEQFREWFAGWLPGARKLAENG
jgi:dihydrodipicolinate synthase/N-acetylneuraminate lyase